MAYTIELDCLPLDVMLLEFEIARWKGDIVSMEALMERYKVMEYAFHNVFQSKTLEKLKSGELKAVDLSFVPEKPTEEAVQKSDQEKLAELEQAILDAKNEMNDAADSHHTGSFTSRTCRLGRKHVLRQS